MAALARQLSPQEQAAQQMQALIVAQKKAEATQADSEQLDEMTVEELWAEYKRLYNIIRAQWAHGARRRTASSIFFCWST